MTHVINLDGEHLTLEDVIAVARHGAICEIDQEAKKAVEASRKSWMTSSAKSGSYTVLQPDSALSAMSASHQKIRLNCKKT